MTCPLCAWSPAELDYPFVHETAHGRVVLVPNQSLPGRCVVQSKRHVSSVAEGTQAETLEWLVVVRTLEAALRSAFGATMFNWSCYMNHVYRKEPHDSHVHPVTLGGRGFTDPHFGNPYDHGRWEGVSTELRAEIVTRLQRAL